MRTVSGVGRVAAVAAVVAAVLVVGILIFRGSGGYTVNATFLSANQLVKGNLVELDGTPVGSVKGLALTPNGQAVITLGIDSAHSPLPQGVHATIRQASQSGIANRYVELTMPNDAGKAPMVQDGGQISVDNTSTSVDLDQLFNTLDKPTRTALQHFLKGEAAALKGKAAQENVGFQYLNPALSTSRRFFNELNRDTPTLRHFVTDSARLVTALANRRDDLSNLIVNLEQTTGAIGAQQAALSDALQRFPDFMRRSNTTFVNLRAALKDLTPLVDASKPVAKRLNPFLDQLQPLLRDAKPTVAGLRTIIRKPGANNDLTDLTQGFGPLASEALDTKNRSIDFGTGVQNLGMTEGAYPQAVKAFNDSAPEIAFGRPYTADFLGWFDDFSTSGGYDALGGFSRGQVYFPATQVEHSVPAIVPLPDRSALYQSLVRVHQYKRCPGAAEVQLSDGSNVLPADQQKALDCNEADRAVGDYKK